MATRQIVLSRSLGLAPQDAQRIATTLGISNVSFVSLSRRAARTPFVASAHPHQPRGGRFLALDRLLPS
jgi:hypothetical protein